VFILIKFKNKESRFRLSCHLMYILFQNFKLIIFYTK